LDVETGNLYILDQLQIPKSLNGLVQFLKDNNKLAPIEDFDHSLLHILSDDVLSKIKANVSTWEDDVPDDVAKAIKYLGLFGYIRKDEPAVCVK
jgi:hypothetical protein